MDVAVAPYPAMDNFYFSPLKMFEYMGSGRAIVASRIGQIDDVLIHGNTAWLVPPGDVDGLVAGLVLLADHPDLGRRLGTAAAEQARSRYRWADVARRLIEVVTDLCQVPARQHA